VAIEEPDFGFAVVERSIKRFPENNPLLRIVRSEYMRKKYLNWARVICGYP